MNRNEMRFEVLVNEFGVTTTPRLARVNAELSLLASGFPAGETPWRLVLDGEGRVLKRIGFDAERLQIGRVVGEGVREFMRALDPQIPQVLDSLIIAMVNDMHVNEIDWNKVQIDFIPMRSLMSMGPAMAMIIDSQVVMLSLPGAERGPYKDDVNAFILAMFKEKFMSAVRKNIPHEVFALAAGIAKAQIRARKLGLSLPDMTGFVSQLESFMERGQALPKGDREARAAWEAEYNKMMAGYFGEQFPEYALPVTNRCPCGESGTVGQKCMACGGVIPPVEPSAIESGPTD